MKQKQDVAINEEGIAEPVAATEAAPESPTPARSRHSARPAEGEGFWQRLARMSEADWQSHVLYCYRLAPKIDAGSDRHFVGKYQRAIDEADLLADHGSGRYLLVLNDTAARKTVGRITVNVYNDQAPPRVRPEQIIPIPENEPWRHWVEEVQAAKAKAAAPTQPPVAVEVKQAPLAETTAREAIRELAELSKKLLERRETSTLDQVQNDLERVSTLLQSLKALLPQPPPVPSPSPAPGSGDQLALIREMLRFIKETAPAPAPAPTPDTAAQLELARQLVALTREMIPAQQPGSLIAQARELAELFAVLRENFGSSPGTPAAEVEMEKPAWERILTAIGPSLAPHLDKLVAALGTTAERLLVRLIPSGPQAPVTAPSLASMPPAVEQPQAAPPEAQAPSAPATDPAEAQRQQLMALVSQYASTILAGINSEDPTEAGTALADAVATLAGEGTYYALAALGREGWLAVLQAHPLWPQLGRSPERLQAYLDGFLGLGAEAETQP